MADKLKSKVAKDKLQIFTFKGPTQWDEWLEKNHTTSLCIWIRFFKKSSGIKSLTHDEALDSALCYGWIDGQLMPHDAKSWLQKFTPRSPKGIWSKRNTDHVMRLIKLGRMKPAGLKEVEAAKSDGRWKKAYDSPHKMIIPDDFMKALSKNKKAKAFFKTLNRANTYAITWRLQTAKKPETRKKSMDTIVEMLANGEKFH